jgi:hypothetical protein
VALDAGGGQARVNRAGDILITGPRGVGSRGDQAFLAALARRDAAGAGLWAQAYTQDARLFSVLEDDGSTLAAGYFTGSLNLAGAELESSRNPLPRFGSAASESTRLGERSQDIALFRLTPQGDVAWARRFGDGGAQGAQAIERAAAGEVVVVGNFVGQLLMDELRVTSSGGGSRADVFIARIDGDGHVSSLWREDAMHVDAIAVEPDGSLWIAGRQSDLGSNRLWKLSPAGQRQLSIAVNDESGGWARKVAPGPAGSLYVTYDDTENASIFGRRIPGDSALVRVSAAGAVEWLQPLSADFTSASLAADAAGNVTVAGGYYGSLDLGAGPLTSNGRLDMFVASFSAAGDLRYSLRLGGAGFDAANDITAWPSGGWLIPFYSDEPTTLGDQQLPGGDHLLWIDEQ